MSLNYGYQNPRHVDGEPEHEYQLVSQLIKWPCIRERTARRIVYMLKGMEKQEFLNFIDLLRKTRTERRAARPAEKERQ